MKVLSVMGTRPEAIKMAPVIRALAQVPEIKSLACTTAQHRQMLDQVLVLFDIHPEYDLDLMREDQSLAELSAAIFKGLEPVLDEVHPDWVLVQGDTTTVAIASLLCYYKRIRVGHVEAGLRTHNKWQPFPEEINRRVATVAADLHFAPTEFARQNLLQEGVEACAISVTGNPVIDALYYAAEQPEPDEIKQLLSKLGIQSKDLHQPSKRLILVTAHRRESFGLALQQVFTALKALAARGDVEIVYPVHPNPNVQEPAHHYLGNVRHITLLPPLDYLPLVHLMRHATLILTDSGGIQEEAPAFGIPVLVMREVTERPEGLEAGILKLVGTESKRITQETTTLLEDAQAYAKMAKAVNPFGDGHAARRIVENLLAFESQ